MSDGLQVRTVDLEDLADTLATAARRYEHEAEQLEHSGQVTLSRLNGTAAAAYAAHLADAVKLIRVRADGLRASSKHASALERFYATSDVELARLFGAE